MRSLALIVVLAILTTACSKRAGLVVAGTGAAIAIGGSIAEERRDEPGGPGPGFMFVLAGSAIMVTGLIAFVVSAAVANSKPPPAARSAGR